MTGAATSRRARPHAAPASGTSEDADPAPGRVVLLHGLWMPGAVMHWLSLRLGQAGFATDSFSYHSVADGPERAAQELAAYIGDATTDIVAHSLGGLVALQALAEVPALRVRRVVCLGSPLRGSGAVNGMLRWSAASTLLGRSAPLLLDGFERWQGAAEVGMVAGRVPHGLGALFGQFDGEHDGTVATAETRLPGLSDHVVIEASHSGLLFSEAAARQAIAFLRHGHFQH